MHKPRPEEPAALYPMRLVTRLTGLSADTIRAWERRHGAVRPSRSSGNTRRFTADEVRRLVLLREATEGGHSIRTIAPLGLTELERLVDRRELPLEVVPSGDGFAGGVSFQELRQAVLGALARFDTRRSFDLLMRAATFLDRETFVFDFVVPTLQEAKDRWSQHGLGSAQEQIIVDQLRSVLMSLLRLSPPPRGAARLLLTCLPGSDAPQDRMMVAALLTAAVGKEPIVLGTALSAAEFEWAVRMSRADVLVVFAGENPAPEPMNQFAALTQRVRPGVQVWFGQESVDHLGHQAETDLYFLDFKSFLQSVRALP